MKKNKINIVLLLTSSFLMIRCAGFQPVVLEENTNPSKYSSENSWEGSSVEVIETPKLKDGVFANFEGDLAGWWGGGDVLKLTREDNVLRIDANKTSAGYPQFGYSFEPKDFTNASVIRVKMRVEGAESVKIRLDLKDVNETSTNASPVINDIQVSGEFRDYYFDLNNKYKQSWPGPGIVDPRQISVMAFFVSPGDKTFKGTIYVKEVYVMANKNGSGIVSKEVLLDDFSGEINYWWGCDKERVLLSKKDESLAIQFKSGQWSCFGMTFDQTDISATPVIRMRVKAESTASGAAPNVDFVSYFTDTNNKTSNGFNNAQKVVIGNDYTDYFFDYKGKMISSDGPFEPKSVQGIIVFINTQGSSVFNGNFYVDEVGFLPAIPEYVSKRIVLSKPFIIDSSWTKGTATSLIDDFSKDDKSWTSTNTAITMELDKQSLKINSSGAGPAWESVSKTFAAVNFIDRPVLKIRLKADGNATPYLRIILTDNYGTVSNARPAEDIINAKDDYLDYYFDFTGRFQQRFPDLKNLNPGAIEKITLYINGGMQPYTGSIYIDDIQTVTVNEYLKNAR